jgi:hypothetical protein
MVVNRLSIPALFPTGAILLLYSCLVMADWQTEQWTIEPFSGQYGGGPSSGPIQDAGTYGSAISMGRMRSDFNGKLFYVDEGINWVDSAGIAQKVVDLSFGYADGPAPDAKFTVGGGYYSNWNMSCNRRGDLFVDDNGANSCSRRIYLNDDKKWMVETYAGKGTQSLNIGESCAARSVSIGGACLSAMDSKNRLVILLPHSWKIYRVSSDGSTVTCTDSIPKPPQLNSGFAAADADTVGNVYFMWRDPGCVYRVDSSGHCIRISGSTTRNGDGPPLTVYSFAPGSLVAAADGSCVYIAGGDEYYIRRIPTDLISTTTTFAINGKFFVSPAWPGTGTNYQITLNPGLSSSTTTFCICDIHGRDSRGNICISLYTWMGMGYSLADHGLLTTRIARLRRIHE